jgi:hypothetical protein
MPVDTEDIHGPNSPALAEDNPLAELHSLLPPSGLSQDSWKITRFKTTPLVSYLTYL